jgi:NADPH-dependent 2,4-dienoyl-CoA reductase/sulfur reductase-like enzyme
MSSQSGSWELGSVVVVGGSLAGLRACETLRQGGFTGTITVVGDEVHAPYDRPPLSKKLLAGEWEPDRIALRKPDDLASLGITWRRGVPATGLDTGDRAVHLADGSVLPFDGLVIATGASVRRLPEQPALRGIHVLRTLDDSLALRSDIAGGTARVVVIGAGFIGLEVAATARALGCSVTVLEGAPAPLVRGLGEEMGRAVVAVHGDHGVDVRCGVAVAGFASDDGISVSGVRLGDDTVVPADVVLVGIGVAPNTEWLADSGLEVRDGVVCDPTLATPVRGVYAAGDVARWTNTWAGPDPADAEMRVEHWTNAAEQGAAAARNLLRAAAGEPGDEYAAVPFFWSDQHTARIQFLGRATPDDEVQVVAGSPDTRTFVALYGRGGRLRAALGVSMPKVVMPFRRLLVEKASFADGLELARTLTAG